MDEKNSHLLQKSSALHTNLALELLVVRCYSNLDEMSGNGIGADWRMCWLEWLLSSTKPAYQCPTLPAWVCEVHLRRQFFPTMPASCIKWLDEMVSYVWVIRLLVLLQKILALLIQTRSIRWAEASCNEITSCLLHSTTETLAWFLNADVKNQRNRTFQNWTTGAELWWPKNDFQYGGRPPSSFKKFHVLSRDSRCVLNLLSFIKFHQNWLTCSASRRP